MATIETKFDLKQQVRIKELDSKGVVTAFFVSRDTTDIQYRVRYIYEGNAKDVYFYDWELEES